jgi:hypothetical protein
MKASVALVAAALCLGVHRRTPAPARTRSRNSSRPCASPRGTNAGPMAPQWIGAQLDLQPTPGSVKRAEERAQAAFAATLARAKRLDRQGNRRGCMRALAAAKRMYNF